MNKGDRLFKFMVIILCVLIMICGFFAIRSTTEETKSVITVILDDSSSERWDRLRLGIKHAASDNNIEVNIVTTNKMTSNEQEELVTRYLQSSDAFIIDCIDTSQSDSLISEMLKHGPVVQINDSKNSEGAETTITIDVEQVGKSLGSEVILHNDSLEGKKVGVVSGSTANVTNEKIKISFENSILKEGAIIKWESESIESIDTTDIDILVICDALELENLPTIENVQVYGIGGSLTDVYKLDTGIITSLIVVNDYYTGYEAISMLTKKMKNRLKTIEDVTAPFYVVNKDNLFSSRNRNLLFIDRS